MPIKEIIESGAAQTGGWLTLSSAGLTGLIELTSKLKVDDTLQILLSIGGLVFLYFKIKNSYLDAKIKKQQIKKAE